MGEILIDIANSVGGAFVWLGGLLLDSSIQYLVIEMNSYLLSDLGTAVDRLWVTIRDLFNILFIFGLIYIGFQTILGMGGDVKKNVAKLIIAALLINFSLFVTKTVVDFTNAISYELYTHMVTEPRTATINTSPQLTPQERQQLGVAPVGNVANVANVTVPGVSQSIGSRFRNMVRLQSYNTPEVVVEMQSNLGSEAGYAMVVFILLLIMAFVFAAGAFMMIGRFAMLIFYMILSPAMFLGMIFPQMGKWSTMWWHGFLGQAFLAPAYLFMLLMSLYVLQQMNMAGSLATAYFHAGADQTFQAILFVILTAGMLILSLVVAKKLGAYGASGSISMLQGARKRALGYGKSFAGGATFGLGARALRSTAGWGAQKMSENEKLLDRASKRGLSGALARAQLKTARGVADSSFDARKIGGAGKTLGIGEGKKGGYKTRRDEIVKKEQAFAKSLGEVGDDDKTMGVINKNIEDTKDEIARLELAPATDNNKAALQAAKIRLQEFEARKKREKVRRQIGTVEGVPEVENARQAQSDAAQRLAESRRKLAEAWKKGDRDALELAQEAARVQREEFNKAKRALAEAYKNNAIGYAGVLESRGFLGSASFARIMNQDHTAGKEIRKTYEKQTKQTKEDENNQKLLDAIKESAKKDSN